MSRSSARATACVSPVTAWNWSSEARRKRTMAALAITDTADGRRILALTGRLDAKTLPELWDKTRRAADEAAKRPVVIDAAGIEYCDGAGVALFVELLRHRHDGSVQVSNLKPAFSALL